MRALGITFTCDRHERDGFYVVYQTKLGMCPYCELEEKLESARELTRQIQDDLARQAERLAGGGA